MKSFKHVLSGYTNHKCRCAVCKQAKAAYQRTPVARAARAAYNRTPAGKASQAASDKTPTRRAAKAIYRQSPEGKVCQAKANAKRNSTPAGKLARNAWDAVHIAIRCGRLQRQPCAVCANPKTQGHHADYSKPLQIEWLCRLHHLEAHKTINTQEAL
jgi:hypothetical protein